MQTYYKVMEGIVWVGQLGFSITVPPLGCLWIANWLAEHLSLGGWVYVVALLLGIGAAYVTFRDFLLRMQRSIEREAGEKRHAYNRH